ncbi:MAG: helix-turn-helix domain-containing protein [Candidatus Woesearchaeota archaeon]
MSLNPILKEIGLAGNESKVYLALLDLGSALAGEITKKSGVNRTNVYDALDKLIEKGLVSYVIEANRKYFEAEKVERFMSFLEEKEKTILDKKKLLNKILPELKEKRKLSKEPQEATIFKGRKGLKSIAEDIINTKKEFLVFGAEGKFKDLFPHYIENWHKRRAKANINIKIIFNESVRKKKLKKTTTRKNRWKKISMKFTKQEETPATTWVYGDKVVIVVWSEQPLATLIRSKDVAKSYRHFFNVLWENARK